MNFKHSYLLVPMMALSLGLAACDNKKDDNADASTTTGMSETTVPAVAPAPGDATTTSADTTIPADTTQATTAPATPGDPMAAPAGTPAPATTAETSCGHQDLVGKTKAEIDMNAIKEPVRVLYPDSPATMDYNAGRVNIILEHGTDKVVEVRCG